MQRQKIDALPDTAEPPPMLASRTCAKIWNSLDNEVPDCNPNSGTFLNSAFFSPETVLPEAFLLQACETEKSRIQGEKRKNEVEEISSPRRSTSWIGLVASVSVGMVIAVFLFPMVRYAERSTRSIVTDSWMGEISRRVDQYEQIHGVQSSGVQVTELPPVNLALSGWQEVHPDVYLTPPPLPGMPANVVFALRTGQTLDGDKEKRGTDFDSYAIVLGQQPAMNLGLFECLDETMSLDTSGLSDYILLVMPGREPLVRLAYGRDVLIKDGRVFFRVPPNAEAPKR